MLENKLYKYRPLSEILFKELKYQEIYFSSYNELNDPHDLSARLEFTPRSEEDVDHLIYFLLQSTFKYNGFGLSHIDYDLINNRIVNEFLSNKKQLVSLRSKFYNRLVNLKQTYGYIWIDQIESAFIYSMKEDQVKFKVIFSRFKEEMFRLIKTFLENSYTTCFSETNKEFLMWSHYASGHKGLCLEFTLTNSGKFPYVIKGYRKANSKKFKEEYGDWIIKDTIYSDRIRQVVYEDEQPFVNFFEFLPVFYNEHDIDLINLSKSWTHEFAYILEGIFSTKTKPWKYEMEWRAIQINFGEPKHPEERIRHYPIEALTGIYFGKSMPEKDKIRISKILKKLNKEIKFFDCILTNGKDIDFEIWDGLGG